MEEKDNVLLKDLPDKLSFEEFNDKIAESPDIRVEGNIDQSLDRLDKILFNFFEPLPFHYSVYDEFYRLLRSSYANRDFFNDVISVSNKIDTWHKNKFNLSAFLLSGNAFIPGFTLYGDSGMGKSTIFLKILNLIPSFISHKNGQFYQVPCVKISIPPGASIKAFCHKFLRELDMIIGTDYFEQNKNRNVTESVLTLQMLDKIALHGIGILIIDEIHNVVHSPGQNKGKLFDYFKNLADAVRIPIIFIGTEEARKVLHGNFQIARRSTGTGDVTWCRLKEHDWDWKLLIRAIWRLQVLLDIKPLFDEESSLNYSDWGFEISNAYYQCSRGNIDVAVKLHYNVQREILLSELDTINVELIERIAKEKLGHLMILLQEDEEPISSYRPIYGKNQIDSYEMDTLYNLLLSAYPHISKSKIQNEVNKVLSAYGNRPIDKVFDLVAHQLGHGKIDKKSKTNREKDWNRLEITKCFIESDQDHLEDIHKNLKRMGFITEIQTDLIW